MTIFLMAGASTSKFEPALLAHLFIYTAYNMHFNKGTEIASEHKENIQNQRMLWNKYWNLKGLP